MIQIIQRSQKALGQRLLALLSFVLMVQVAPIKAQWTTNGNNISNSNSGHVEVATKLVVTPTGSDTNPVLQFNQSGNPGFYVKNQGSTNQIVAVTEGPDSSFMFQNRYSQGYAGPTFLSQTGAVAVFTGYSNSTGEYRVNNIVGGGSIKFLLGVPVMTIQPGTPNPLVAITGNLTVSGNIG